MKRYIVDLQENTLVTNMVCVTEMLHECTKMHTQLLVPLHFDQPYFQMVFKNRPMLQQSTHETGLLLRSLQIQSPWRRIDTLPLLSPVGRLRLELLTLLGGVRFVFYANISSDTSFPSKSSVNQTFVFDQRLERNCAILSSVLAILHRSPKHKVNCLPDWIIWIFLGSASIDIQVEVVGSLGVYGLGWMPTGQSPQQICRISTQENVRLIN